MHKRICHVFTFAELEDLMQNLLDDRTIHIEEGYPALSMYSEDSETCYDEDEILDHIGTHFKKNLSWAFPIYDAKEVYIIESQFLAHGLPELVSWEWIDSNTFSANFGTRFDEDGDEYELAGKYHIDTGEWFYHKLYEEYRLYVHLEDHREAMRQQMTAILKKENVIVQTE